MFDAPGHLRAVIGAMMTLGVMSSGAGYSRPPASGASVDRALNPTSAKGVNFVQALTRKYISYFADKGCKMFNIAADECGFTNMDPDTYTAYAEIQKESAAQSKPHTLRSIARNISASPRARRKFLASKAVQDDDNGCQRLPTERIRCRAAENGLRNARSFIKEEREKITLPAECTARKKDTVRECCPAACHAESGDYTVVPEYFCHRPDAFLNEARNRPDAHPQTERKDTK